MKKSIAAIAIGVLAAVASSATAHGPQIQITSDNNKIVTRQLQPGNSYSSTNGLTTPASVYVLPVKSVLFNGNPIARVQPIDIEVFGPGFTYGYDQSVPMPGPLKFTAGLELHVEGLQIWNGTSFVDTGAGKEQLGIRQSSSNVLADTHKTVMGGNVDVPIPISAPYPADAHSSVRYQLLGDGLSETTASRDGIYLVTLELSGTQTTPSLLPSDTFYYILSKNVDYNALTNAVSSFAAKQNIAANRVQYAPGVIPEPSAIVLAGIGIIAATIRLRRPGSQTG